MFPATDFKIWILGIFCSLFLLPVSAQVDNELINSKPKYIKKAGKRAFKNGDYYSATEFFKKYLLAKPTKVKVKYYLANSYRMSRDYVNAEKTYQEVLKEDAASFPKAYYFLAQMEINLERYALAQENLKKFKKVNVSKDAALYSKYSKLLQLTCEKAPLIKEDSLTFTFTHLDTSINKAHVELSPLPLSNDLLLYSSFRTDTMVYYDFNDSTKTYPVRKFYLSKRVNNEWVFDKEFEGPFNQSNSNNGNACFNSDSSKMYFTRCEPNSKGKTVCAIFESKKGDSGWETPVKLPETINLPDYNSSQPAIGTSVKTGGGEVLYFVSERPEGKGGKDIYFAEYLSKKKVFKAAKNAGSKINTVFDDVTPFYDIENKTMYFSSEGWPGMGGLDIFSTVGELREWGEVKNVGYPLNTSVDELYYAFLPKKDEGFLVSNRKGGVSLKSETCCDDIYHFKDLQYIYIAIKGNVFELFNSKNNTDSLAVLEKAKITLYAIQDSTKEELALKQIEVGKDGSYFLKLQKNRNYLIKADHEKVLADGIKISTIGMNKSDTLEKNFQLIRKSEAPIIEKNIYYDFDRAELTPSSTITIDTTLLAIMEKNPLIIIEIGSHTDSKGTDEYNRTLSQKRAESVVNYLIKKGITSNRLRAKGYGEKVPLAPNENPDGSDSEEGRAKNRRTEFKVVGEIKGVSAIIYEE